MAEISLLEVMAFHARYAELVDGGEVEAWPALFTDPCLYLIQQRENRDRGLPLATVRCESRGMLKDRVVALRQTQMYAPRYVRHVIGLPHIVAQEAAAVRVRTPYSVFETLLDQPTHILSVGTYHDRLVRGPDGLLIEERACVYDSQLIPTSLVWPI